MIGSFPIATYISNDDIALLVNQGNIIISNINLLNEVYNENFHYSRLIAEFVYNDNNLSLPIFIYDSNLESLLFPHLFSDGKDHYYNMKKYA